MSRKAKIKKSVKTSKSGNGAKNKEKSKIFKLIAYTVMALITLIVLELLSTLVYNSMIGESFSRSKIRNEIRTISEENLINETQQRQFMGIHVLHPYLGYGKNKETRKQANDYAMIGPDPIVKKSANSINIAITGGSVANHFYGQSKLFIEELKKYPKFKDKDINIICLALEGYKQPQQLIALNYFNFLGAEYDIFLNIDGYNDLVLSYNENLASGVNPYFPRTWNLYAKKTLNPQSSVVLGEMNLLKQEQVNKARFYNKFPFNFSNFLMTLWSVSNKKIKNQIARLSHEYQSLSTSTKVGFQEGGPQLNFANESQAINDIIEKWSVASRLMAQTCKANGTEYYHFLQPNQYVVDSKWFSDQEKKTAYINALPGDKSQNLDYRNGQLVEKNYAAMLSKGKESADKNSYSFTDLTMIFKNTKESVYQDFCCHLNKTGNQVMAEAIAKAIK